MGAESFGSSVNPADAPYLYEILNNWTLPLVLIVGAGVGLAAVIGTIRFVKEVVFETFDISCFSSYHWLNSLRMA